MLRANRLGDGHHSLAFANRAATALHLTAIRAEAVAVRGVLFVVGLGEGGHRATKFDTHLEQHLSAGAKWDEGHTEITCLRRRSSA